MRFKDGSEAVLKPDASRNETVRTWAHLIMAIAAVVGLTSPASAGNLPHSPNVEAAGHEPPMPRRGQPVSLSLELADAANVTRVEAIYCRVEGYACGPALLMAEAGDAAYSATIPWTPRFFDGVRTVGYRFIIHFRDGTNETSPLVNHPDTPSNLPEDADIYYFYKLPEETPGPTIGLVVLIGLLVLAARRRSP